MLNNKGKIESENLIYAWRVKAMLQNIRHMIKYKYRTDDEILDIINGYIEFADGKDDVVITHWGSHDTIFVNNK